MCAGREKNNQPSFPVSPQNILTALCESSESESISELMLSISQCLPALCSIGAVRFDLLIYEFVEINMSDRDGK